MTTRTISTRIALALLVVSSTFMSSAFAAATTVRDASAALSFWVAWGLVYLGVGVVLLAVAVAIGVGEGRAWSSLLQWTADESGAEDEPETHSRDAA